MSLEPAFCRSCPAEILWTKTVAGKAIPLDAVPVENGNYVLVNRGGETRARALKKDEEAEGSRYLAHFATCPQAPRWRRK